PLYVGGDGLESRTVSMARRKDVDIDGNMDGLITACADTALYRSNVDGDVGGEIDAVEDTNVDSGEIWTLHIGGDVLDGGILSMARRKGGGIDGRLDGMINASGGWVSENVNVDGDGGGEIDAVDDT